MAECNQGERLEIAGKIALGVGGVALGAAAGLLAAKSGVFQSASARHRREKDEADGRFVDGGAVAAGTPILVSIARGAAEHSGVYLGDSRVAELSGEGRLQEVSLTEFINGQEDTWDNFRSGTRIFAACDDQSSRPLGLDDVADAAKGLICRIGTVRYHLFGNNCHMFTASCVFGKLLEKMSVADWFVGGTYSVDRLEEVIVHRLNGGAPVSWLGVRASSPQFQYALCDAKVERLHKEGKA